MRQTFIIRFKEDVPEESCYEAWSLLADYLKAKGAEKVLKVLPKMSRVWTEILLTPEGAKCIGFATLGHVWDVANFHCDDDRTRARLIQRISTVIEESQGERTVALVRVDPDVDEQWQPLLQSMGAQPANRWLVPAGATMEKGGKANDAKKTCLSENVDGSAS